MSATIRATVLEKLPMARETVARSLEAKRNKRPADNAREVRDRIGWLSPSAATYLSEKKLPCRFLQSSSIFPRLSLGVALGLYILVITRISLFTGG
eukprot:30649-Pelagococcus_subviridis.AAC.4